MAEGATWATLGSSRRNRVLLVCVAVLALNPAITIGIEGAVRLWRPEFMLGSYFPFDTVLLLGPLGFGLCALLLRAPGVDRALVAALAMLAYLLPGAILILFTGL